MAEDEKREGVPLAASLFGDDTAGGDIFGSIAEPATAAPAHYGGQNEVDDLFGSVEQPPLGSEHDAQSYFSQQPHEASEPAHAAADIFSQTPADDLSNNAYQDTYTHDNWSSEPPAKASQPQDYSVNYGQWQDPSYAPHNHVQEPSSTYGGQGFVPSTPSHQNEPSNAYAPSYAPANSTPTQPAGSSYCQWNCLNLSL